MEVSVFSSSHQDTGRKVDFSEVLNNTKVNEHLLYLDVKRILAAQRQGTHKAKERGEITGSTRKLRRQKGSGAARIGSVRSPILRGGGRIFGPRVRDYSIKINSKERAIAKKSAFLSRLQENKIEVIENIELEKPQTKKLNEILSSFAHLNEKIVLVAKHDRNLILSARNLKNVELSLPENLNTLTLLRPSKVVVMENAVEEVQQLLSK